MNERSDGHVRELTSGDWMFGVRLGTRRRYLKRAGYPTKTAAHRARKAVVELVAVGDGDEWFQDRIVDLIFERTRPGRTLPTREELRRLRGAGLDPTAPSKLVADYAEEWLATKLDRRPSTQAILRHRVGHHLRPSELGGLPLDRVTRTDVKAFLDGCVTLGPRARQQLRATLKSIFQMAVEDGLVPRNPAAQVKTSPPPTRRPTTWTRDERDRFLAATGDDPLHPLLTTMVRTGIRRGEACGLRWCDLDLDAVDPYLRIEQQVTLGPGGTFQVGDPKTKDSRRTVMLDPATVAVLEAHRRRQREERMALGLGRVQHDDFAFGRWDHRRQAWLPPLPNSVAARFERLCKAAGVTVITPHGLRHTYATLLVEAGVPDRVIADQLGHRDTRFTASVYVHPPAATRAAILARAEGWNAGG